MPEGRQTRCGRHNELTAIHDEQDIGYFGFEGGTIVRRARLMTA